MSQPNSQLTASADRRPNEGASRARWSEMEEKILVDTLLLEVRRGRRAESGFKITLFSLVQEEIRRIDNTTYEIQQIRNKYNAIKKDYDVFTSLKSKSGFGWNEDRQVVEADDEVWDIYLKSNPAVKKFRRDTLRNYSSLQELFDGVRATGESALLPSQLQTHPQLSFSTSPGPNLLELQLSAADIGQNGIDDSIDPTLTGLPVSVKRKSEKLGSTHYIRPKRERKGKGSEVAEALLSVCRTAEKLNISKIEEAINILMEEYIDILSEDEMLDAVSIFETLRKSEIFVALKTEKIREGWLRKQISLIRELKGAERK